MDIRKTSLPVALPVFHIPLEAPPPVFPQRYVLPEKEIWPPGLLQTEWTATAKCGVVTLRRY